MTFKHSTNLAFNNNDHQTRQYQKLIIIKKLIPFLAISICFNLTSLGQTLNVAKLDSFFHSLAFKNLAMGSLTISKNGIVQYRKAIGYSFVDSDKKIFTDINTKYRTGSATKMFTAVMIFQLVEI